MKTNKSTEKALLQIIRLAVESFERENGIQLRSVTFFPCNTGSEPSLILAQQSAKTTPVGAPLEG